MWQGTYLSGAFLVKGSNKLVQQMFSIENFLDPNTLAYYALKHNIMEQVYATVNCNKCFKTFFFSVIDALDFVARMNNRPSLSFTSKEGSYPSGVLYKGWRSL